MKNYETKLDSHDYAHTPRCEFKGSAGRGLKIKREGGRIISAKQFLRAGISKRREVMHTRSLSDRANCESDFLRVQVRSSSIFIGRNIFYFACECRARARRGVGINFNYAK